MTSCRCPPASSSGAARRTARLRPPVSRPGGSTNSYGGCPPDERILASLKIRARRKICAARKIGARYSHILFALLELFGLLGRGGPRRVNDPRHRAPARLGCGPSTGG